MSDFLYKLTSNLDTKYCGHCANANGKIKALGENARRMLEIGIVQDELVKLGFSRFGLCDYALTDNQGTQIVGVDFVNQIVSTSYFGGEQYYYSYLSPTFREDVINKVKELIK